MRLRLFRFLLSMGGVAALAASPVTPSHATNLITTTVECEVAFASSIELYRTDFGVSTYDTTANPQSVICSLPRTTLNPGALSGAFYVDGNNYNGASTSCAITSFDADGHLAGIVTFTTSAATFDQFVSMSAAQLPPHGHATLSCMLPAHGNGRVRGVTSIQ